jgi:hypothetical protein
MSLRSRPRDVVIVQKRVVSQGKMGEDVYTDQGDPIPVHCNVYPVSATESESLGLVNSEVRQVFLHQGTWPADQFSELTYDGAIWEQQGRAVPFTKGQRTKLTRIYIHWLRDLP